MKKIFISIITFLPSLALAAETPETFKDVVYILIDLVFLLLPIMTGLSLLVFFWGMAKLILKAGDEKGREEGKMVIKWGIIGLFVSVSLFGILSFFHGEFEFGEFGIPMLPTGFIEPNNVG